MSAVERHSQESLKRSKRKGFEPSDAPARGVAYAVLGLFAGIGLSLAFVAGMFALFGHSHGPSAPSSLEAAPPARAGPRLEISPEIDRAAIEAAARTKLEGYAWTDRKAGRAHIPIDRAMELLARQGWPDGPNAGAPQP
ncbi:hypothetical protein SAZ10_17505 [Mesorhizobium sp. BAC0120]|uniref:hypothetical protein n=1 Tax=Mesorhizobium sp. BAC0120 TaxID=3090670 RepID=UPI00298BCA8F|nr:hypothetical protein [Mesorhizobium sp. BAC0120]MDW6023549.1 hypothetical protein [Mesorhizobium sp. BAC0120]